MDELVVVGVADRVPAGNRSPRKQHSQPRLAPNGRLITSSGNGWGGVDDTYNYGSSGEIDGGCYVGHLAVITVTLSDPISSASHNFSITCSTQAP